MDALCRSVCDTNIDRILGQLTMETGAQPRAILLQLITAGKFCALAVWQVRAIAGLVYPAGSARLRHVCGEDGDDDYPAAW